MFIKKPTCVLKGKVFKKLDDSDEEINIMMIKDEEKDEESETFEEEEPQEGSYLNYFCFCCCKDKLLDVNNKIKSANNDKELR